MIRIGPAFRLARVLAPLVPEVLHDQIARLLRFVVPQKAHAQALHVYREMVPAPSPALRLLSLAHSQLRRKLFRRFPDTKLRVGETRCAGFPSRHLAYTQVLSLRASLAGDVLAPRGQKHQADAVQLCLIQRLHFFARDALLETDRDRWIDGV